jgi:ABC-type multidrug transport system ATPase subunit
LINALTLDAFYGRPIGSVTLNGIPLTDEIFKQHCYVVVQHDKHWPYLTCRETLRYAAELYDVAAPADIDGVVDEIIAKMGLAICRDTRNARLSGGQRRRLSLGVALLKQPTLLFLDEPTTGLDAAAAENIMQEIVNVAKNERLIILCTIHQPSTKVYNGFDEVMILSKGREAYSGPVNEAIPYFDSIGYPLPVQTNPAGTL